jgi:hypothetical protein
MNEVTTSEKKEKVLLSGDYKDLDEELKKDIKFMTELIQLHPKLFFDLTWKLKKEIIEHNPKLILDIQKGERHEVATTLIEYEPTLIRHMNTEIFDALIAHDGRIFDILIYLSLQEDNFGQRRLNSNFIKYNPLILIYLQDSTIKNLMKKIHFLKLDTELFHKIVERKPLVLRYVEDEFKKDKDLILELLQRVPEILKYVDDIEIILEFFNDSTFIQYIQRNNVQFSELLIDSKKEKKLILELVRRVPEQLKYVGDIKIILELFDDLYFMQKVKESNFCFSELLVDQIDLTIFKSIGIYLMKDKNFIKKLIWHINGFYYTRNQNVEEFKFKIQLALLILQHDGLFLKEASLNLNKIEEIVFEAVKQNGLALQFADSTFFDDDEMIKVAVGSNGMCLQILDSSFKENKEIVMIAVKNNGMSLEFASKSLKEDPLIVLEAIKQNVNSFEFCNYCDNLCDNEEIYKELFQKNYNPLVISPKIRKNREIMLITITGNATNFHRVDDSLKHKPFILEALQQNGMILEFLDDDYKKDFYCVQKAIKQNGISLKFAHEELKNKKELIMEAVLQNGEVLQYLGDVLDEKMVIEIVQQNGMLIQFLGDDFKENPVIAIEAVKQTKGAAQFVTMLEICHIELAIKNGISYEDAKKEIDNFFQIDYDDI